jgi:hypothetical protein
MYSGLMRFNPSFPKVNLAIGIGHGLFDWSKVTNVIAKRCLMGETDVLLSTSSHIFSAEACSRPPYLQKPLDRQNFCVHVPLAKVPMRF